MVLETCVTIAIPRFIIMACMLILVCYKKEGIKMSYGQPLSILVKVDSYLFWQTSQTYCTRYL